jgi:hypothetical protein
MNPPQILAEFTRFEHVYKIDWLKDGTSTGTQLMAFLHLAFST